VADRVLLVEDRDALREALARHLRSEDFEVRAVATLTAAREALADDDAYDVVVSDVRLPDGLGDALTRALRTRDDDVGAVRKRPHQPAPWSHPRAAPTRARAAATAWK
jgi:DNA-binding response OmpR family regulator